MKKIKELHLIEPSEIPCFLNYLDPEKKKSLSFPEFSCKIRPNALQTDPLGNQTYIPYTSPAQEHISSLQKTLPAIKQTVVTSKEFFTPSSKEG